jgi:hypothetical protein
MTGNNESLSWKFYFFNIIMLGAFLGLAEALLGKFIRNAGLPRSPFVAATGFLILALGLAVFKQKRIIPGITIAGILSKWLAVPILGLPLLCQVNDHFAILLNGAFLFAGVAAFRKHIASGWRTRSVLAGLAAFGAGATFFALGRFVSPCAHLLSFRYAGGVATYMLTRVVPASLLAAVSFPLGYALGRSFEKRLLPLWLARPPLLVPLCGAFTVACLGLTVLLTAVGF